MSDYAENTAENDENKIPVNIITGFLGSGKTTLLNHWVNSPEFKDTLVLINEFGDVGLDHELVEAVDGLRAHRDEEAENYVRHGRLSGMLFKVTFL